MSQAEASSWWADVEHLRDAAERRHAADAARRSAERGRRSPAAPPAEARARTRAAIRVQDSAHVDELTARRAIVLDDAAPRARRPVPIWLAEDAFADPVAAARARASAPRRTVEIRGQVRPAAIYDGVAEFNAAAARRDVVAQPAHRERLRAGSGLGSALMSSPDRLAFWAFALGVMLTVAAAAMPH